MWVENPAPRTSIFLACARFCFSTRCRTSSCFFLAAASRCCFTASFSTVCFFSANISCALNCVSWIFFRALASSCCKRTANHRSGERVQLHTQLHTPLQAASVL